MVANTAPVQGQGQGSRVVAGGLFGFFTTTGVGLSDAYNWGEVTADSLAGGIWGIYEDALLVDYSTSPSDLNNYARNIYNAAPVNAPDGNPVGATPSCPDSVDTSFTALIYNDSAFSHDRGCIRLKYFDKEYNLASFYVYTSPLSTKYMQSDAFVDLLNTSGNTTADRHVWKRSQTYPVFDEAALEMSVGSKPPESSSSSGTAVSSSSSKKVDSSSSSAKSSSSKKTEASSSSKKVASSSSAPKSSSSKAGSSSSKKSGKSSSSSAKTSLPVVAQKRLHLNVNGKTITLHASKGRTVQVFDALGHHVMSKAIPANGETSVTLQESGAYIVRVDGMSQRVVLK